MMPLINMPEYDMNNPEWIERKRQDNSAYNGVRVSGITEFPHQIKRRNHGHAFHIGEMVSLTSESVDDISKRCGRCKDSISLSAQNKEGLVFYIKNCELL